MKIEQLDTSKWKYQMEEDSKILITKTGHQTLGKVISKDKFKSKQDF